MKATVTDPALFRSEREFSAFLGLVPRQNSSGGKDHATFDDHFNHERTLVSRETYKEAREVIQLPVNNAKQRWPDVPPGSIGVATQHIMCSAKPDFGAAIRVDLTPDDLATRMRFVMQSK